MFRIGNLKIRGKVILAPMAGITNIAYRKLCEKMGAAMTYTEMTSNVGLKHSSQKTFSIGAVDPEEKIVALQIFGGNVGEYVASAKYWDQRSNCSVIDINMGCPVPKVAIRSQAGSSLLQTPEYIGKICQAIVGTIKKPLTIKIRIGWDSQTLTYQEVAKTAEKAGVAAIAVHGRTRSQMYKGRSDWDAIKKLKQSVKIPVIGNGDITNPEVAKEFLEYTQVDAVMVARAARDNPWIFRQVNQYLEKGSYDPLPDLTVVLTQLKDFYEDLKKIKGNRVALLEIRGTANNWLTRFKDLKQWKQDLVQTKNEKDFVEKIDKKIQFENT